MILNYNGREILLNCVSSLEKTSYTNFDIFVIDNASTDDSITRLRKFFPQVKIIQFDKNYGFCQAYNKASKIVDADYFLFLNNDITIVNSDWLSKMVKTIISEPLIGAVGSKLLLFDDSKILDNIGGTVYKWQGGVRIGFGEEDKNQYDKAILDYNKAIELNPNYANSYNNRGIAYFKRGKLAKGCSDWKKACKLGICKAYNIGKREGFCN